MMDIRNDIEVTVIIYITQKWLCSFPQSPDIYYYILQFTSFSSVYLLKYNLFHYTIVRVTNKMQLYRLICYSKSALHVSDDVFAHHQKHLTVFTVSGSVHPSWCRLVSWMSWKLNYVGCKAYAALIRVEKTDRRTWRSYRCFSRLREHAWKELRLHKLIFLKRFWVHNSIVILMTSKFPVQI
jgi:hypothetical protein